MKVLFAIKEDNGVIASIERKFKQDSKTKFTCNKVDSLNAIMKELQKNSYNRVVVSEDFDEKLKYTKNTKDQAKKYLKKIASSAGKAKVIFCANDKSNIKDLIDIDVYNVVIGKDKMKKGIYDLLNEPNSKEKAIEMYGLSKVEPAKKEAKVSKVAPKEKATKTVSKASSSSVNDLFTNIKYLNREDLEDEKYVKRFDSISSKFDKTSMEIIVKALSPATKKILRKKSSAYNELLGLPPIAKKSKDEASETETKRRGRPRKEVTETEDSQNKVAKKRGRPRKEEEQKAKTQEKKNDKSKNVNVIAAAPIIKTSQKKEKVESKVEDDDDILDLDDFIIDVEPEKKAPQETKNKKADEPEEFDLDGEVFDLDDDINLEDEVFDIEDDNKKDSESNDDDLEAEDFDFDFDDDDEEDEVENDIEDEDEDFDIDDEEESEDDEFNFEDEDENLDSEEDENDDESEDDDFDLDDEEESEEDDFEFEDEDEDPDIEEDEKDEESEDDDDVDFDDEEIDDDEILNFEDDEEDEDETESEDDEEIDDDEILNFEDDEEFEDEDETESEDDEEIDDDEILNFEDDEDEEDLEENDESEEDDESEEEDDDTLNFDDEEDDDDILNFDDEEDDEEPEESEKSDESDDEILNFDEDEDEGILNFDEEDEENKDEDETSKESDDDDDILNFEDDDSDENSILNFDEEDEEKDEENESEETTEESDEDDDDLISLNDDESEDDDLISLDDDSDEDDDILNLDEEENNEEADNSEEDTLKISEDESSNTGFGGIQNINYNSDNDISKQINEINEEDDYEDNTESSRPIKQTALNIAQGQKIVAFVGGHGNGTSFIVNNIASLLADQGISVAILDVTKNKNSYYIYTENQENLRGIAFSCFEKLSSGIADGIKVNKNLTVYTSLPNSNDTIENKENAMNTILSNNQLVLIDCDVDTEEEYFELAEEIYLVQSLDILTIQPLTSLLKKLKMNQKLDESKLRILINKEIKVNELNDRILISAMSVYNSPDTTYQLDLFNRDTIQYLTIPFEEKNYCKYLGELARCKLRVSGYSKSLINSFNKLAKMIYPIGKKRK